MNDILQRITIDEKICHGKPCVRGMRYPVEFILELLASGMSIEQIINDYPDLEVDDIKACIMYANQMLKFQDFFKIAQ